MQTVDSSYLQQLLRDSLQKGRSHNPAYSLRAFALRIGLSHSATSEILSGKRTVGAKVAGRLADALMVSPDVREKIFSSAPDSKTAKTRDSSVLRADQFRIIADWSHFAILSLLETKNFKSDLRWIAKRLSISVADAASSFDRLQRLGLVKIARKKFYVSGESFDSPDGVADSAVRSTHDRLLELARESLHRDSIETRDFSSMTMAIDPAKLPEAKKRLRKFRDELCEFLESGDKTEIYSLNLQLFPLSREV